MKIAIEGCCHNQLELIYKTIDYIEKKKQIKIDLLLICGDVETIRNKSDLDSTSMPDQYKEMGTFYKYYSGELKAPIPTIFIGGNHEASNYLWELYYGGWVCENVYYLGCSGVVNFGGLRIGGLSGIYKQRDYGLGHFETFPYTNDTIRSIYHVRRYEMFKLNMIRQPIDIFLSHDWPENITRFGNENRLKQIKRGLAPDIEKVRLGNPYCELLLYKLKPRYWFAAHLHVKFAALIPHEVPQTATVPNPDEIPISLDETIANQDEIDDPDELPSFIDDTNNANDVSETDKIHIINSEEIPVADNMTMELPLELEDLDELLTSATVPNSDEIPISLDEAIVNQDKINDPDELPSFIDDTNNANDVSKTDKIHIVNSEEMPVANNMTMELPLELEDLDELLASATVPKSDEIPISLDEAIANRDEIDDPDELPSFIDNTNNANDVSKTDEIHIISSEEMPVADNMTMELPLELEDLDELLTSATSSNTQTSYTRFLSLDKCLPGREFLQVLDFPEANGPMEFSYDEEWLAITKATDQFFSVTYKQVPLPTEIQIREQIDASQEWVRNNILQKGPGLLIPKNFRPTAPAHNASDQQQYSYHTPFLNPQTIAFTQMLEIENKINPSGQTVREK
ncbi:7428_t:CDS:10 [Scutellospora calospora]|uniref:7428_t:CDS:1 n=1 Tax=Scutellospora calospora TaxID=85575 RepID=A0ACA9L0Q5_9GLOM|nr:7428_t:CDS:10 [Scutellospora calospora]